VHGYNNTFDDVARAYEIIEDMCDRHLDADYDAVLGYTWPGGDNPLEWYPAKRRAGMCSPRLAAGLRTLAGSAKAVDVMCHSLGSLASLNAIYRCPKGTVRNLAMLAAAVDNESLEKGEEYFDSTRKTRTTVVFHTKNDDVLRCAFTLAEWDAALGLDGPENPADIIAYSPNVKVVNGKNKVNAHGHYKYVDEVYEFLHEVAAGAPVPQFSTL
jgi:esterase/lipase superfamily enzyme